MNKTCKATDYYYTPREIVDLIFDRCYLPFNKCYLFPCDDAKSEFVNYAFMHDLRFANIDEKRDFFNYYEKMVQYSLKYDIILANPPFSNHFDWLEMFCNLLDLRLVDECYVLLPLSTLETYKRSLIYNVKLDTVYVFVKRICFKGTKGKIYTPCCVVKLRRCSLDHKLKFIWND